MTFRNFKKSQNTLKILIQSKRKFKPSQPNNDEPWIEFAKLEQARAKAHYQACLEKERAKELAKQQANTLHSNELDYDPETHAGLKQNDNINFKGRNR